MAKKEAKESARLRDERITGTDNGLTLRTRVVRDRTKYSRKIKHRKSPAETGDFPFIVQEKSYLNMSTLGSVSRSLSYGAFRITPFLSKRQSIMPRRG